MRIDQLLRQGETREEALRAFMSNVVVEESGCWLWRGKRDVYGNFRGRPAYVASWLLHQGWISDREVVLHGCDLTGAAKEPLRGCVNPAHLRPGSRRDNSLDVHRMREREQVLATREEDEEDGFCLTLHGTTTGDDARRWEAVAQAKGIETETLFIQALNEVVSPWIEEKFLELFGEDSTTYQETAP